MTFNCVIYDNLLWDFSVPLNSQYVCFGGIALTKKAALQHYKAELKLSR